jgi:hypothetical protein
MMKRHMNTLSGREPIEGLGLGACHHKRWLWYGINRGVPVVIIVVFLMIKWLRPRERVAFVRQ